MAGRKGTKWCASSIGLRPELIRVCGGRCLLRMRAEMGMCCFVADGTTERVPVAAGVIAACSFKDW